MRALPILVLLAAFAPLGMAGGATTAVHVHNLAFAPGTVTVDVGDVVVWDNEDGVAHTVSGGAAFDSGLLLPGHAFSWAAAAPGVYDYRCAIHASMRGTLLVRDPTLPDLMVDGIVAQDAPLVAGAANPEAKDVTVFVANHGGAAAPATVLRLSFTDSAGAHPLGDVAVPALEAGAGFPATFHWDGTGIVGTVTLDVRADATGLAAEGPAEANDDASASVGFLVAGGGGVALLQDARGLFSPARSPTSS